MASDELPAAATDCCWLLLRAVAESSASVCFVSDVDAAPLAAVIFE